MLDSHGPFVLRLLTFKAYFMSAAVPATELKRGRSSVQTLPNQALGTEGKMASHCSSWPCRQRDHPLFQVATATIASMLLSPDYPQPSPQGSGSLHPSPWGNCSHVLGDRPAAREAARSDQTAASGSQWCGLSYRSVKKVYWAEKSFPVNPLGVYTTGW